MPVSKIFTYTMKKIGIFANTAKPQVVPLARKIVELAGETVQVAIERSLAQMADLRGGCEVGDMYDSELIISLGGDGTMLSAARAFCRSAAAILGINVGRLGFLTELLPDEFEGAFAQILAGNFRVERRMMIEARSEDFLRKPLLALNEVVVDKGGSSRTMTFGIEVNGSFVGKLCADGLIIATPTGSTAYSMAAGGAIVAPNVDALLLTAIAPYTLAIRPLLVRGDVEVEISFCCTAINSAPKLTLDGQIGKRLPASGKIIVRKSAHEAKFVKLNGNNFFDVLRTKLGWGPPLRLAD